MAVLSATPARALAAFACLLAAVAIALSGCSRGPRLARLESDAVVLAFGDSLTFGTGADPRESYPAALERAIGRKVVNAGVPGETSAEGLARLPEALDEARPRLMILCHGGNDFLRRLDEARAAENVRAMIRLARDRGVAVVLLATPKPGLPPSVPRFYGEIAAEFAIPFEDAVVRSVLLDNALKSDMVHPNARGYSAMAAALQRVLAKSGAI
jgi:lysophospholipase L1-like esterase